ASGQYAYAILPSYSDISSVTFYYRYESTSYGTLTVGYVTTNSGYSTYTVLATPGVTDSRSPYTLSSSSIATINSNNGYLAFRYEGSSSTYYSVGIDDIEICTTSSYDCSTSELSIAMGGEASLESDGRYYYDVCLGDPVNLVGVVNDGTAAAWRWYINSHNGSPDVSTQQSPTYTPDVVHGYDITLTARDENGCPAFARGRIRVSGGLDVPAQVAPAASGVCQGSERIITIGDAEGSEIQVARESYEVTATLGESNVTFIPDGTYCDASNPCYESPVTFNDFSDAAVITSVNDIKYVKINMEHTHIGDMHIKLECPNGRSAIILQDAFSSSAGGLDNATYVWPYYTIHFLARFDVYENTGGDGRCERGSYQGTWDSKIFVGYNNGTYYLTGIRQEATAFPSSITEAQMRNHLYNAINSGSIPADFCVADNYYVFNQYCHDYSGYSVENYYEYVGTSSLDYLYDWGYEMASLGFGNPNAIDARSDNICSSAYNSPGTGADYCWSSANAYSYSYAGSVISTSNHIVGQTNSMM
ncbi:MAG: choice-of-anchor J domain-containing protein, partial [Bacteroidales bacterium]|nr:choice-of-anchor J domain-containing protein [Bacteroidales bacterium]